MYTKLTDVCQKKKEYVLYGDCSFGAELDKRIIIDTSFPNKIITDIHSMYAKEKLGSQAA